MNRNHAFDLLCGLCIVRMMMLHAISLCGDQHTYWFGKLMAWSFFFMSFFFFKAGYFNKGTSGPTLPYLKDRVQRLLVPYATWGLIGSAIYFGYLLLFPDAFRRYYRALSWHHLWDDSHVWGNPPLWFLFSFFVTYVVVHLLQRVPPLRLGGQPFHLSWLVLLFPFVSYHLFTRGNPLPMSLDNVFMGVFFFYLGKAWHWLQQRVPHPWLLAASIVLVAVFIYSNKHWHGQYDMSLNKFYGRPWGAGLNTVFALVGLSGLLLSLPLRRVPLFGYIGQHSMVYFVAHYPLLYLYAFTHLVFHHTVAHHWEDFILMMAFTLITCTWLVPYVERVPWLSGRIKKA